MPLYQVEKLKGRETIIRDICQMDWDLVVEWIKSKVKGNPSRYVKEYRDIFMSMANKEGKVLQFSSPLMDELSNKLKIAV